MTKKQDRPNLLLLMTDQQRPDTLRCGGSRLNAMPNLDRLADEGVVFDNCYVQNPLCCPSRYSILTGRYPHSHRVRSNWYAPREGEISFGHCLGRSGYRTAIIGKMHLTPWQDCFGFDGRIIAEAKFDAGCPDDYERFLNKHGRSRKDMYNVKDETYIRQATAIKSKFPPELHIDTFVGSGICEYLKHAEGPFCAIGSFLGPHNPYDPPEPYDRLYLEADLPKRNMRPGEVSGKPREAYEYINNRLKFPYKTDELTEDQLRLQWAYYLSCCTHIDDWIGRVVAVLKEQGLYDNTVIVFMSDHGDLLGDHGLVYKQCFYEQSVRVPLIVHCPAKFKPGRVADLVESIDVFPTLCELGGAWPGEGVQGRSLLPLLAAEEGYVHRTAAFSENHFGRMVRYKQYKLVYYPGKPYGELYDLERDIEEQVNLWDDPQAGEVKREMKDLLLEWAFASEDPLPLPVRGDHFDDSPLSFGMVNGAAALKQRQPWYVPGMEELYREWNFSENRTLR